MRCEAPQGFRVEYGGDGPSGEGTPKLQKGKDDFRNVNPVYIFDDAAPQAGIVIWGGTVPEGMTREQVERLNPTEAKTAAIIYANENQVILAELVQNGLWVHSLYPKRGIGIFSRQTHWTGGLHAIGSIFVAACNFTRVSG